MTGARASQIRMRHMNRRLFLKLPTLLPLIGSGPLFRSEPHHFKYDFVIGTSLDLTVCAPSSRVAEGACQTIRNEIDRLRAILDTRDRSSEISRLEGSNHRREVSSDLTRVLEAYDFWERQTGGVFSIRPNGVAAPRNVDALGKAYILDRAAAAALTTWPSIDGLLLDIGGDIVNWGPAALIAIADPGACYDNADPIATIDLHNRAVATSGTYARGAHLTDCRSGAPAAGTVAATVVAADAVTANALATTLCVTDAQYGLHLVESTPGAEALRIESGGLQRTSGFARLERRFAAQARTGSTWPAGYRVSLKLPLTARGKRPYVAVWVDDASGKLVRGLALWGGKSKYYGDLSTLWGHLHGNFDPLRAVTRATRPAGQYDLVWDGLDNDGKPVPPGTYRITVETNQEHGSYAKQSGTIEVGESPSTITLPATSNFDAVVIRYGPT
jgi:FAD:protein FMN transferase